MALLMTAPVCPYRAATAMEISVAIVMLTCSGPSATSLPNITTETTINRTIEPITNSDAAIDGWVPPPSVARASSSVPSDGRARSGVHQDSFASFASGTAGSSLIPGRAITEPAT